MKITMLASYSCVPNSFVHYLTGERLVPGRLRAVPESLRLAPALRDCQPRERPI